ncbi:signal peptidase I [Paenibacillus sp. P26]|nr:signal peptidase I [Paenibacillus sp. P26]
MKKMVLMLLCCLLCAACTKPPVKDTVTRPAVGKVEPKPEYILYYHDYDNMDRGKREFTGKEVAVDPDYYKNKPLSRGDIVFFKNPEVHDSDLQLPEYSISRVVGLPGERVKVEEGQIYINGAKLETFYGGAHRGGGDLAELKRVLEKEGIPDNMRENIKNVVEAFTKMLVKERTLQADQVFLVGDDWIRSADSVLFGPVRVAGVVGKVLGYAEPPSVSADTKRMSREEALQAAKRLEPSPEAKWNAVQRMELFDIHGQRYARPVWTVTAVYPAGNKTVIRFDTFSGLRLSLGEMEPPGKEG